MDLAATPKSPPMPWKCLRCAGGCRLSMCNSFPVWSKSTPFRVQTESCQWPERSFGVIMLGFLRQFNVVFASILQSIGVKTHGCPHGGKFLAARGIRLAAWGFVAVRTVDRALTGAGMNLGWRRVGLGPVRESAASATRTAQTVDYDIISPV